MTTVSSKYCITPVLFCLCYFGYIYSGLSFLLLSFQSIYVPRIWPFVPSWPLACVMLACGNFLHQCHYYTWKASIICNIFVVSVVLVLEEVGLRTHLLFGQYAFHDIFTPISAAIAETSAAGADTSTVAAAIVSVIMEQEAPLGMKVTHHLPVLVICLWLCMVYPTFILTNLLLNQGNPSGSFASQHMKQANSAKVNDKEGSQIWSRVGLAAALLALFDFISEPPMVLFGHRVWRYFASPLINETLIKTLFCHDPGLVIDTLRRVGMGSVVRPDWYYAQNQWLSHLYFGIPMQNFVGWLLGGSIIYYGLYQFMAKCGLPLLPGGQVAGNKNKSSSVKSSIQSLQCTKQGQMQGQGQIQAHGQCQQWLFYLPVAVSNFATVVYLVVHPIHPLATRVVGSTYLIMVSLLLRYVSVPSSSASSAVSRDDDDEEEDAAVANDCHHKDELIQHQQSRKNR